ncbi:MAG: hypothetical protein JWN69_1252 [Alphaproteobacteria bacterium]|nr:hypothetical protein [Alphaproteobacteria bacterium]
MSPEPEPSETIWRNRFIAINLVRIGGTALVLIGLLVWQTDWLRAGGWAGIGLPLALLGLLISFGGPRWLAARWRTPPR